jgi:hypothetical protein
MANDNAKGTYALPNNGDYDATLDPNPISVVLDQTGANPVYQNISSSTGSDETINVGSNTITIVDIETNGGLVTLGSSDSNKWVPVDVVINDMGAAAVPGDYLHSLREESATIGNGGGTDLLGTVGASDGLSDPRIVNGDQWEWIAWQHRLALRHPLRHERRAHEIILAFASSGSSRRGT